MYKGVAMIDWNGNGKHDRQDDMIMYHIIQEEETREIDKNKQGCGDPQPCFYQLE